MLRVIVKVGREKSLLQGHPWLFSGAIERVNGEPESGETVQLTALDGRFLGWAAWSPQSQIRARVWSTVEKEPIDRAFFARRIAAALRLREALGFSGQGRRVLHGESDGLPGFIADQYGDMLVLQVLSAGAEVWRDTVAELLLEVTGARAVYERSDVDVRTLEGLPARSGPMLGTPTTALEIVENGIRYAVDIAEGQKTGFYLDQRDNRRLVGAHAQGRRVLNCFCYSGGFSLAALRGGATEVLSVDSSAAALAQAQYNLALNDLPAERAQWLEADVFQYLRGLRDSRQSFDLIVLDPPKFAPTAAHVDKAARAYKDINLLGLKLLRPGGLLFTYTCSGGMSAELFQKILAGAAADAGCTAHIVQRLSAAADHPVALHFPEGDYLKGLMLYKA